MDISDFECRNVVGTRQAGLIISETVDVLYFYTQPSLGFKENGRKRKRGNID